MVQDHHLAIFLAAFSVVEIEHVTEVAVQEDQEAVVTQISSMLYLEAAAIEVVQVKYFKILQILRSITIN